MEQVDRTKAAVQGKTIFVRIPKPLCKLMGIVPGDEMNVYRDGNKIVYEKDVKDETH